jgi:GNAT superfamily N-acetyltransferase
MMQETPLSIALADPAGPEAQACLAHYFEELQQRFDSGFDPAASVSANPEELVPPSGYFLIARLDGAAVACGALKVQEKGFGELKRMWVAPRVRGMGLARQLLAALEAQAVAAGVRVLRLDTSRHLPEAHALYIKNGYVEIAAYNDNRYADHWFEKRFS